MLPAELLLGEGFSCADGTRGSLGPPLTGAGHVAPPDHLSVRRSVGRAGGAGPP